MLDPISPLYALGGGLILGVGAATKIDYVEIRWPSGKVDKLTNPPLNSYVKVVEGSGIKK